MLPQPCSGAERRELRGEVAHRRGLFGDLEAGKCRHDTAQLVEHLDINYYKFLSHKIEEHS